MLGVMLIVMGRLKLASVVQYLPMPVIGGYLAFIGFFCGEAGLAMMAGVTIESFEDWLKLLHLKTFVLWLPGLLSGFIIYYLLRTVQSPYVLPLFMGALLSSFFLVTTLTGTSLEEVCK